MNKNYICIAIFIFFLVVLVPSAIAPQASLVPNPTTNIASLPEFTEVTWTIKGGSENVAMDLCHSQLNVSDATNCANTGGTASLDAGFFVNFTLPSNNGVNWIWVNAEIRDTSAGTDNCRIGAYNFTSASWFSLGGLTTCNDADVNITFNISSQSDITKVVSGTAFRFAARVWGTATGDTSADYLRILVNYNVSAVTTFRPNVSAILTLTSDSPRLASFTRQTPNGFTLTGPNEKILAATRSTANTLTLTSPTLKATTFGKSTIQSITATEKITTAVSRVFERLTTNAMDLTEVIIRIFSPTRLISNAIDLAENIQRIQTFLKSTTQALDVTDNIQTLLTRVRLVTQATDLTDAITRLSSFTRSLTNSFTLTAVVTAVKTTPLIERPVALAITLTESVTRVLSFTRSLTNTIDLTEAITRIISLTRSLTNAIGLTETVTRLVLYTRNLTSAIDITEAFIRVASFARGLTSSIDLVESFQKMFSASRTVLNAINVNIIAERTRIVTRLLSSPILLAFDTSSLKIIGEEPEVPASAGSGGGTSKSVLERQCLPGIYNYSTQRCEYIIKNSTQPTTISQPTSIFDMPIASFDTSTFSIGFKLWHLVVISLVLIVGVIYIFSKMQEVNIY